MKTIYVVTSGSYSDYSINGLFSTLEKAQAFMDKNKSELCCDQGDIEEWNLDELVKYTSKTVWFCKLGTKSGTILRERRHEKSCPPRYTSSRGDKIYVWSESSVSPEHAHKLAVEKRQEVLRLQDLAQKLARKPK